MDFFAQQDHARRQTSLMLVCFSFAIITTILLLYSVTSFLLRLLGMCAGKPGFFGWNPGLFAAASGITLAVVLGGTFYKIWQLNQKGGSGLALLLGGRLIEPEPQDYYEKRLRNVVEEMAISSGLPVPFVYVMNDEMGINSFAAGLAPYDSVIAVTFGAMTCLNRDELQAVIAHEFSHILNSDTALNMRLIGWLHGLLVVGYTGKLLLRVARLGTGNIMLFLLGICFYCIGYLGCLCSKLIKNLISWQREFLADASAIQFTRNPGALADALKKIGGLTIGSGMHSPRAELVSHMCFGDSTGEGSLFSTHPPLTARIKRVDPTFDGRFDSVRIEDLQQCAGFEHPRSKTTKGEASKEDVKEQMAVTLAMGSAGSTFLKNRRKPCAKNPEELMASIGRPAQQNVEIAKQLLASIPEKLKQAAQDPVGARALVYLLLLDVSEKIRSWQLKVLREQADPEVYATVQNFLPLGRGVLPEMRLPLIELCVSTLRFVTPQQYAVLRSNVKLLMVADEKIDVFEYALQYMLIRHLDNFFSGRNSRPVSQFYATCGLEKEVSCVLSVLARKGNSDSMRVMLAFAEATEKINDPKAQFELLPEEQCRWEDLDHALGRLSFGSLQVKKWVLGAALVCLMHDKEMTVAEVELFRAISSALGCPVPPWVTPATLPD